MENCRRGCSIWSMPHSNGSDFTAVVRLGPNRRDRLSITAHTKAANRNVISSGSMVMGTVLPLARKTGTVCTARLRTRSSNWMEAASVGRRNVLGKMPIQNHQQHQRHQQRDLPRRQVPQAAVSSWVTSPYMTRWYIHNM